MSEHRRRILRRDDTASVSSAAFLVDVPGKGHQGSGNGLQDMIDAARQAGRDEGYRAAMEELAAAEASARSVQLRRVADALVSAAASVHEARVEAVQMGAAEAAELAYELTEAFLQRELNIGRPHIEALARALQLVPDEDDLVVRLHPNDVLAPEELKDMIPEANVRVVADPRVESGGCVVVAGPCRIDAQIGAALERARRVLAELYPEQAPKPENPAAVA